MEPGWAITKSNASALNHPNVCTVHDAEHGNQSSIVMEYVDGRPLDDMIAEAPLAPAVAMDIAAQVAGARARAEHRARGFEDGQRAGVGSRTKVVDFGLARRHGAAEATASEVEGALNRGASVTRARCPR